MVGVINPPPTPMTVLSKEYVFRGWIAGIAVSNPTEGVGVRLFFCCVCCREWPLLQDDHSFRGVLSVVCAYIYIYIYIYIKFCL